MTGTGPVTAHRCGFVTLVGRPNVGKSSLVNAMVGTKVSITSTRPQTTRHRIMGVRTERGTATEGGSQLVFVDTPGLHRPRTALGERLNTTAVAALDGVDVRCVVIDASAPIGPGDRWVAASVGPGAVCVVNKVDLADRVTIASQLAVASSWEMAAYFAVSARSGDGVDDLVAHLLTLAPLGPPMFPDDVVTDVPEAFMVAELVREQLLERTRDELPHSIATRVTEWEWPLVRCEILVERESQKGIVIGRGGEVLKAVGTAVRSQLAPGAYLELVVKVDRDWQRRPAALARLGF